MVRGQEVLGKKREGIDGSGQDGRENECPQVGETLFGILFLIVL